MCEGKAKLLFAGQTDKQQEGPGFSIPSFAGGGKQDEGGRGGKAVVVVSAQGI